MAFKAAILISSKTKSTWNFCQCGSF